MRRTGCNIHETRRTRFELLSTTIVPFPSTFKCSSDFPFPFCFSEIRYPGLIAINREDWVARERVEEIPGPRVVEDDEGVMVSPGMTTVVIVIFY